ncbi:hypothetical protein ACB098_08G051600 [Castanea mollissima]
MATRLASLPFLITLYFILKIPLMSLSFSTNFVFAIVPQLPMLGGHGLALTFSPSWELAQAIGIQFLGLFNASNNGLPTNYILAIELDTVKSTYVNNIDSNHVGIDVNGVNSTESATATYFSDQDGKNMSLELLKKLLNVTIAPTNIPKPNRPLLSTHINLSQYLLESMYVGFSASIGAVGSDHYILRWSFNKNGQAQSLDETKKLPRQMIMVFLVVTLLLITITGAAYIKRRKNEYGPLRFIYKNLYKATKGFSNKKLLRVGGFGKVYKEHFLLPKYTLQSRNKRVNSCSSMIICPTEASKIFYASMRNRNKLFYIEMLRDFGLAKLSEHGANPQTTHVAGIVGYLAPKLTRTRRATTYIDVFAFGVFMLEVACGRRPVELQGLTEEVILVDWVFECWRKGSILDASDPRLEGNYVVEEIELVLKLGLLCSHSSPFLDDNVDLPELPHDNVCFGNFTLVEASDILLSIPLLNSKGLTPSSSTDSILK